MVRFLFAFFLGFTTCAAVLWLWLGKELRRVMSARDEIDRALRDLNGLPPTGPVPRHHPHMDPVEEHGGRTYLADNADEDEGDGPGWAPWWDEAEAKGRGTTSRADEAEDHNNDPDNQT